MAFTRISFPSQPFVAGGHPLERKKTGPHSSVALLEFAPGFADPAWCTRAHVFYVLEGELTLQVEVDRSRQVLAAGEGCVLDRGTRHRAGNAGAVPVVLLAVSDLVLPDR